MPARVAKAAKDAKEGRKATKRVASAVKKSTDELKKQLKKLEGFDKRKKDPGGSLPATRTLRYKSNDGQKKIKPVQSKNRNSQVTEQKGALKGAAATAVTGGAVAGANKLSSKNKSPAKKTTVKKLPLYKKGGGPIHMEGSGRGVKYYQNGKQVRIK